MTQVEKDNNEAIEKNQFWLCSLFYCSKEDGEKLLWNQKGDCLNFLKLQIISTEKCTLYLDVQAFIFLIFCIFEKILVDCEDWLYNFWVHFYIHPVFSYW